MGTIKIILTLLLHVTFLETFASTVTYESLNYQVFEIKMTDELNGDSISKLDDDYTSLSLKQLKTQRVDGLPEMPVFTALLISPKGSDGSDIIVEYSNDKQVFPGKFSFLKAKNVAAKQ